MQLLEGVMIALEALWTNKLRTILTLLGNIVAVMSVIAVVSMIDGANSYIESQVAGEGSGVFHVQRFNTTDILSDFDKFLKSLHNPEITTADLAFLRERVTLAQFMDSNLSAQTEVRNRAQYIKSVPTQGRSDNYVMLGRWEIKDGRHFTSQEVLHSKDVAVLGFDVADRLYPNVDPIGKEIKIGGETFRIIGVLAQKPTPLFGNPNLVVIIPLTSFQKMYGSHRSLTISIKPISLDQANACMDQTRQAMRVVRRLGPKRDDNFAIVTQDSLLKLWSMISSGIFAALIGIVSISLVVGGIVIMNIMLVSVTERTREIGIRKAVGATRMNILWQFLVEAITLSCIGGILGILAGFALAAAISYFSPLPYAIKVWSIAIGLGVTFIVGVFFGAYPAVQAAKLDPIEALRYE
jgi:putative ABC transport system permease protein